jgi:hypothetical protein
LIDEIRLVAENGQEGIAMSVPVKRSEISSSASPSRLLIATIGGRYLAFDAEPVQGILTIAEGGYLHDPVAEGIVYRAVDLAARLSLSGDECRNGVNVVLLAEQGIRGSVRVEKVHGLLEIPQSLVLALPAQFCGPEQRWYRGMILFEGSVAMVLNTTWVLEEEAVGLDAGVGRGEMGRIETVQGVVVSKNREC